jgi:hypothetical protein
MDKQRQKQATDLNDFLLSLDSYAPTYPENLIRFYLDRSGLEVKDDRITKLMSLAADKLLSEILYEAKQISTLRQQNSRGKKRKFSEVSDGIDIEDLQLSLLQLRIFVRRRKLFTNEQS